MCEKLPCKSEREILEIAAIQHHNRSLLSCKSLIPGWRTRPFLHEVHVIPRGNASLLLAIGPRHWPPYAPPSSTAIGIRGRRTCKPALIYPTSPSSNSSKIPTCVLPNLDPTLTNLMRLPSALDWGLAMEVFLSGTHLAMSREPRNNPSRGEHDRTLATSFAWGITISDPRLSVALVPDYTKDWERGAWGAPDYLLGVRGNCRCSQTFQGH
ncbi:hypothetical protein C8R47DRAFT_1083946 [Mycena vitilis]|nr:hypothetical protein C8R47DRAFT_1083946 [Mycena vitilis]